MAKYRIKDPFVFTIFGASGDLAKLKIFPAIYRLLEQKRMPKDFCIVGYARTPKSRAEFQEEFRQSIKDKIKNVDAKLLKRLIEHVYYFSGSYDDFSSFKEYSKFLKKITKGPRWIKIAYFAVPPTIFEPIIGNLGKLKKSRREDVRLIIEKPFGTDTESARKLFHFVGNYFDEGKVYLLDHYLGKFSVQSILNLRHSNRIVNLMMKGREVANIQISAFEDFGVQNRFGYYEHMGAFKDMIQSHLLQILSLVSMSIPITNSDASLHREKYSILSAIKFNNAAKNIIAGQYHTYANELKKAGMKSTSPTETFSAIRLFIDRESWYKVPIYIRTGKNLHQKKTYVVVELKKFDFQTRDEEPNRLIIELQPEPKISIQLTNKQDGAEMAEYTPSHAIACIGDSCLPEHSNLILDVIRERKMNFISFPEVIASWRLTDKIVRFMKSKKVNLHEYKNKSKGPEEQHLLTAMDNFKWYDL